MTIRRREETDENEKTILMVILVQPANYLGRWFDQK
jgi:hypothetical protein